MSTSATSTQKSALEFKSASLTVPVLSLSSNDLPQISQQIGDKVAQAPEFFRNSPLLLDLQKLNAQNLALDLDSLLPLLQEHGFLPIGIRGGNESQNQQALALKLPIHSLHSTQPVSSAKPASKTLSGSPADGG